MIVSGVAGAAGRGFRLPAVKSRTFANGLEAHAMEYRKLPLFYLEVTVRAGAARDPEGREGLANLVANLLRKGAGGRTAREIADATEFVGGALGAAADRDGTRLTAEFLAKDRELGLALLRDMLVGPSFADEEIERLKRETISGLRALRESPGPLASRRFVEFLYRGHPYGHAAEGWEESVAAITREDVRRFHEAHYTPDNLIVVAVGDFDSDAMLEALGKELSGCSGRGPEAPDLREPEEPDGRSVVLLDKPDATQSQIRIGGIGIRRMDPDYINLQVANAILGRGFTSRLVQAVRVERGLSYGIDTSFYPLVKRGPFILSTFTKCPTTLETIQVALEGLERFAREGATEEEVSKARKYLRGTFAIEHQSPESLAGAMSEIAFYGLPADYCDTYLRDISDVTVDDVRRTAASKFPVEKGTILVLGPAKAIGGDLESLGPVTVLPIASAPQ